MIYVASPYSHPELYVRIERYKAMLPIMAQLAKAHIPCYSPIVHWHNVEVTQDLSLEKHELWKWSDIPMMDACRFGLFVKLDGWQKSRGMGHECDYMRSRGKIDHWIDPHPSEIQRWIDFYPWRDYVAPIQVV